MVLKIIYSASQEESAERIERREIEKKFDAYSDSFFSKDEIDLINKKNNPLRIDGGKIYERNESRITQLVVKTTKSF